MRIERKVITETTELDLKKKKLTFVSRPYRVTVKKQIFVSDLDKSIKIIRVSQTLATRTESLRQSVKKDEV